MSTVPFETALWGFPISNRRTVPSHPLRVSNIDAQISALPTLETEAVSSVALHTDIKLVDMPSSGKEKGSTANAALWDDGFFHHEGNQHYPDLDRGRIAGSYADNQPSLIGEALRLQVTKSHLRNSPRVAQTLHAEIIESVTYESFVVQSFGYSFAFLRCPALSLRPHASSTQEEKLAPGLSAFSLSTLMLISSIKSCGKRIPFVVDRLFLKPVAISFPFGWCRNTIQENKQNKIVDVYVHLNVRCMCTLIVCKAKMAKPESATNTCRASIHNVTEDYTMALSHSTQTRPEKTYLWRFLALNRSDMSAKPCPISVEAPTEHDARRVLAPFFILSLSARLSAQGVCNA